MVYATSKPTVAQQISTLGFQIAKKLEVRDGADLTEAYLQSELFSARTVVKSSPVIRSTAPQFNRPPPMSLSSSSSSSNRAKPSAKRAPDVHPVYSLMAANKTTTTTKKIVIPPPGAW
jgi:hypothetical protein